MPDHRLFPLIAAAFVAFAIPAHAAPLTSADWKQLEDTIGDKGDHIVGEELCALPVVRDYR